MSEKEVGSKYRTKAYKTHQDATCRAYIYAPAVLLFSRYVKNANAEEG